jgi:ligand-binding sensor domain-containing protein/signal transduction histidine kinase
MKPFRFILPGLILLFQWQTISAQHYFFTNYTINDGLSNNTVTCIVKDRDGFVWAGTESGLNRFNGYDFTVYKSVASDSTTLHASSIRSLLVDAQGTLWVSTAQGICRYKKEKNCFQRLYACGSTRDPDKIFECHDLFEDSKKNIWAGTAFGLLKYNSRQDCFEQVNEGFQLNNSLVGMNSVTEDADGTLWANNYYFLVHYNPLKHTYEKFENRARGNNNSKFQALRVFADASDKNFLWITTWGDGLVHFNKQNHEFTSYKFQQNASPNLDNIVFSVFPHSKNKLWVSTNRGILVFNIQKKIYEGGVRDSISEKTVVNTGVRSIYLDNDGITWIGTFGGLANIHPAKQNLVNHPLWLNAPVSEYYYNEAEDKFYGTVIYTKRSLIICDRKTNKEASYKIPQADELRAEPLSLVRDNKGLIWIGTTKGIYTFDESQKTFSLFNIEEKIHIPDRSIYVRQIIKDSAGNLWFACYSQGLLMVDANTKKITSYLHDDNDKNSFPLYALTGIAAWKGKTLYISDDRLGVVEFNYAENRIVHFSTKEKKYASLYDATDVAVDNSGFIWVTTRNNGLIRIDKNHEVIAFIKDDSGNIIDEQSNIVIDNAGKIWLNANHGIYCFNPDTKSFTQFTLQDGLPYAPLAKIGDGKIAINIPQGIFYFDPLNVSKANKPLNVHLTGLLVNGKHSEFNSTIDWMDTIRLLHSENNLTIEFAATDFAYPSSTLYSYKLEGINNNWSTPARSRSLNFSQLAPGNFTLHLRAGNNSPVKKLFIRIIPAWWQTTWFKWLAVLTAVAILFFSIRFFLSLRYKQQIAKLEQQRQIENIRVRISRDIHDEIGSGLTKIKLMSRSLSKVKQSADAMETTTKISHASDELIQNLGEIVWTINPANDTLENVFAFARNYVSKLFDEHTEIKSVLDFTEPADIPRNVLINPEVKRNLLLILKEALNNVVKHSEAKEVCILLRTEKSELVMKVSDNGKGISKEQDTAMGNGLKNMRKRAESINAEIKITSEQTGTAVHVFMPLTHAS